MIKFIKKYHLTIIAFIISVIINLVIFIFLNIFPFGENTLFIWDMEWQYSSFLAWFRNVLLGKADWAYSLIGGFGGNTIGLISYYLSSPLNFILLLFDLNTLPLAVFFLTLLRTGLMASSMQLYLYNKRKDSFSIIFGCMYSLSSFVICYQSNIMWFDALILLPLIIHELENLIKGHSGVLYTLFLGLAIISNYYMAYMLCIFCIIYFFGYFFLFTENIADFKKIALKFILHSAIAGGLSAFLILPTIYNLRLSSNKHMADLSSLFDFSSMFSYKDLLPYFMSASFDKNQGITGSFPLIYCGIFPVFLIILFFTSAKIKIRDKIINGILLIAFLFSMNSKVLYLLWHGNYSPVGSPWRYSFLWTFLFLSIAYQGLICIEKTYYKSILISLGITFGYFIYMVFLRGFSKEIMYNFLIILCLFILYFSYTLFKNKYISVISILLSILICGFELSYNAFKIHSIQFSNMYEQNKAYITHIETTGELLSLIEDFEPSNQIYRTEILHDVKRSFNDGYLYNINTLNMYSSSEKQINWNLFYPLGLGYITWCADYDNNATSLSRAITGIKYFITSTIPSNEELYEKIAEKNGYILYHNTLSLPLGFLVNETALNMKTPSYDELFIYQNNLQRAFINGSSSDIYENINFSILEDTQPIPGRIIQQSDGSFTDGQKVYIENLELLKQSLNTNSNYTLSLSSNKDSNIKGNFFNPTNKKAYVCFTFPYENAWKIKVDGNTCKGYPGMGGFLLVPIEPGEHMIELKYQVPYLALGYCISIVSLLLLLLLKFDNSKNLIRNIRK